jgi:hypothetical protein
VVQVVLGFGPCLLPLSSAIIYSLGPRADLSKVKAGSWFVGVARGRPCQAQTVDLCCHPDPLGLWYGVHIPYSRGRLGICLGLRQLHLEELLLCVRVNMIIDQRTVLLNTAADHTGNFRVLLLGLPEADHGLGAIAIKTVVV